MSGYTAGAIVACVLAFGLAACCWQIRRAERSLSERDQIIADARNRTGLPAAAPDNQPGADYEAQDFCELTWAMPAFDPAWDAGRERLWNDVRDTQNGDTP